jgi:hypothetical protein
MCRAFADVDYIGAQKSKKSADEETCRSGATLLRFGAIMIFYTNQRLTSGF